MRSWTQRRGLSFASCASKNPAQPPSRGWTANSSERVGRCGFGKHQRSPAPFGSARGSAGSEGTETAPPATRERPLATRLTTFLFYFCSLSRDLGARVNGATRRVVGQFENMPRCSLFMALYNLTTV
jgi:hypothetical protein